MRKLVCRFWSDKIGATAIEYGLIAMLVFVTIIGILKSVGTSLKTVFTTVNGGLTGAAK